MSPAAAGIDRCRDALSRLGQQRACLLSILLLVNALALPYAGFVHDAKLYSVQVLNRAEGGTYDDDLFFRHGSQDQYSAFSAAVAPLACLVGVPGAFFLVYLVSKAALLYGMIRLVEATIAERWLSTLSLLYLAANRLPYAGFDMFHVNESFLTPRLLAEALVLIGLADLIEERKLRSFLFLLASFPLHPLMALGGLGVYLLWLGWERLPRRWFGGLFGGAVALTVFLLACPPLARQVFGHMDAEWSGIVALVEDYNFPALWPASNWIAIGVALLLPAVSAWLLWQEQPRQAQFLLAVAVVAVAGMFATTVASLGGYALLFQGQPYRAIWITKVLEAPLTVLLAARLWHAGSEPARLLALVLVGRLAVTTYLPLEFLFLALAMPFAVLVLRGLQKEPRNPHWLSSSSAVSLAVGFVAWGLYRTWIVSRFAVELSAHVEPYYIALSLLLTLGPALWMLAVLWLATAIVQRLGTSATAIAACGAIGLAVQLAVFLVPGSEFYASKYKRRHQDIVFLADFLEQRTARPSPPTVYWAGAALETLWLELGVKCYYDRSQLGGVLFSRETALEALRRARLVGRFEGASLREELPFLAENLRRNLQALYQVDLEAEFQPTRADLARLCRDQAVDYVVVPQRFDGWFVATNGRFYVYDCARIQAILSNAQPEHQEIKRDENADP